jgi:hypothetical protein
MTKTSGTQQGRKQAADKNAIRPFQVNFPEAELTELRRRITATRFPEKETVADFSQGVPLATVQKLARYWATEYDWRKVEARLNAVPNFLTVELTRFRGHPMVGAERSVHDAEDSSALPTGVPGADHRAGPQGADA